jgi:hypothetical protein
MIDYCGVCFAVRIIRLGNYWIPVQSRRVIGAQVNFLFFPVFPLPSRSLLSNANIAGMAGYLRSGLYRTRGPGGPQIFFLAAKGARCGQESKEITDQAQ